MCQARQGYMVRPSLRQTKPTSVLSRWASVMKQAAVDPSCLSDPGAVDLERVANVIVDHSLQDCVFSKEAGRMCYAIIQVGGLAERVRARHRLARRQTG